MSDDTQNTLSGDLDERVVDATEPAFDAAQLAEPFSVEDILGMARLPERTASICVRADLQGEWDRLLEELSTLVNQHGEILDSAEPSAGDVSAEGRALQIQDRMNEIRGEMRKAMWHVTFRAMDDESWATFKRMHKPKDPNADHTDFQHRLVCETAISPTLSKDQLQALRKKLGPTGIAALTVKAWEACTSSGLDVPKLPASLRNLAGES